MDRVEYWVVSLGDRNGWAIADNTRVYGPYDMTFIGSPVPPAHPYFPHGQPVMPDRPNTLVVPPPM